MAEQVAMALVVTMALGMEGEVAAVKILARVAQAVLAALPEAVVGVEAVELQPEAQAATAPAAR